MLRWKLRALCLLGGLLMFPALTEGQGTVRVIVTTANVRMQPSMSAKVIDRVQAGTVLEVVSRRGDWYEVTLPKSQNSPVIRIGFVAARLVEAVQPPSTGAVQLSPPAQSRSSTEDGAAPKPTESVASPSPVTVPDSRLDPQTPQSRGPILTGTIPGPLKETEYRAAKNRRLMGWVLTGGGLVVALAASPESVSALNCLDDFAGCGGGGNRTVKFVGLGAMGYGVYLWFSGQSRMNQIERERAAAAVSTRLNFGLTKDQAFAGLTIGW